MQVALNDFNLSDCEAGDRSLLLLAAGCWLLAAGPGRWILLTRSWDNRSGCKNDRNAIAANSISLRVIFLD